MLPDRVSNPGPLTYESGALPIALRGPAHNVEESQDIFNIKARFHVTVRTQFNKFVFYFIVRRNVKFLVFRMLIRVLTST